MSSNFFWLIKKVIDFVNFFQHYSKKKDETSNYFFFKFEFLFIFQRKKNTKILFLSLAHPVSCRSGQLGFQLVRKIFLSLHLNALCRLFFLRNSTQKSMKKMKPLKMALAFGQRKKTHRKKCCPFLVFSCWKMSGCFFAIDFA